MASATPASPLKPRIFEYLDYRKYLQALYRYRKGRDRRFNLQYIADSVGLKSVGHITWILQGKRNISKKNLDRFAEVFALEDREARYFRHLVQFNQSVRPSLKKSHFEALLEFQGSRRKVVPPEQHAYFQHWYLPVLREMLEVWPTHENEFRRIGARLRPPISQSQVRKGMRVLEQLNLVEKDAQGFYHKKNTVLTTGEEWRSVVLYEFQKEAARLGEAAIDAWAPEDRDVSTLTFSISEEGWQAIRTRIAEFRKGLIELITADTGSDRVGHLNLQLFPVTEKQLHMSLGRKKA